MWLQLPSATVGRQPQQQGWTEVTVYGSFMSFFFETITRYLADRQSVRLLRAVYISWIEMG